LIKKGEFDEKKDSFDGYKVTKEEEQKTGIKLLIVIFGALNEE